MLVGTEEGDPFEKEGSFCHLSTVESCEGETGGRGGCQCSGGLP